MAESKNSKNQVSRLERNESISNGTRLFLRRTSRILAGMQFLSSLVCVVGVILIDGDDRITLIPPGSTMLVQGVLGILANSLKERRCLIAANFFSGLLCLITSLVIFILAILNGRMYKCMASLTASFVELLWSAMITLLGWQQIGSWLCNCHCDCVCCGHNCMEPSFYPQSRVSNDGYREIVNQPEPEVSNTTTNRRAVYEDMDAHIPADRRPPARMNPVIYEIMNCESVPLISKQQDSKIDYPGETKSPARAAKGLFGENGLEYQDDNRPPSIPPRTRPFAAADSGIYIENDVKRYNDVPQSPSSLNPMQCHPPNLEKPDQKEIVIHAENKRHAYSNISPRPKTFQPGVQIENDTLSAVEENQDMIKQTHQYENVRPESDAI